MVIDYDTVPSTRWAPPRRHPRGVRLFANFAAMLNGPEFSEYSAKGDAKNATGVSGDVKGRTSLSLLLTQNDYITRR